VAGGGSGERRQRARCGSGSGEARGGEDQCAAMRAMLGSREEVGSLGRWWERAEEDARLRRWTRAHARKRERQVFIAERAWMGSLCS
jgi:hypothetical protein